MNKIIAALAVLLFAAPADAAIVHVQDIVWAAMSGSGTSWNTGAITAIGTGNAIAFEVNSSNSVTSVSDNASGNTYVIQGSTTYGGAPTETLITGVNIKGHPTQLNITFSGTESSSPTFALDEYSGVDSVNAIAGPVYPNNTGSPVSVNITTTVPSMLWGFMNNDITTFGPGSGFTQLGIDTTDGNLTEQLQQSAAGTTAIAFTQTGATFGPVMMGVAFAPPPPPYLNPPPAPVNPLLAHPAQPFVCDRYVTDNINCRMDQQGWKVLDKKGNVIQSNMNHRDCMKMASGHTPTLGLVGYPFSCVLGNPSKSPKVTHK